MIHRATKRFGHEQGISCIFRMQRHDGSIRYQGHSLTFKVTFEARFLDDRGHVLDTSLFTLKEQINSNFGNRLIVAANDPAVERYYNMDPPVIDTTVLGAGEPVTCETLAKLVFNWSRDFLRINDLAGRVFVHSVECVQRDGTSTSFTHVD